MVTYILRFILQIFFYFSDVFNISYRVVFGKVYTYTRRLQLQKKLRFYNYYYTTYKHGNIYTQVMQFTYVTGLHLSDVNYTYSN